MVRCWDEKVRSWEEGDDSMLLQKNGSMLNRKKGLMLANLKKITLL
jgi:hypothetical protein